MSTRKLTVVCSRCLQELSGSERGGRYYVKKHKKADGAPCSGHLLSTHWAKEADHG